MSMELKDAIAQGKSKNKIASSRKSAKRVNRELTVSGVGLIFRERFEEKYGQFPLITKKDMGMLMGFVRLCKENNRTGNEVYSQIESIVDRWDELSRMPTQTLKGVEVSLPPRPSLSYFLTCRDSLLHNISEIKKQDIHIEATAAVISKPAARNGQRIPKKPSQADIDREYADAE